MAILEDRDLWIKGFQEGWLAHLQRTGSFYWEAYIRPRNRTPVAGPGIELASARLMLISSAGGYLAQEHLPFDASSLLGDYTIRFFPPDTPFDQLAFAHEHYDHAAVNADPQVLLPLGHLGEKVEGGRIGALSSVVSFMGYQPDVSRVVDETIPAILKVAKQEQVTAALLVPS